MVDEIFHFQNGFLKSGHEKVRNGEGDLCGKCLALRPTEHAATNHIT